MSKYFVIYGYCGPDNYTSDNGPILEVKEFDSAERVEAFYKEWMEDCGLDDDEGDTEKSHVTFRIIEGVERSIKPVETVTKYKLG